MRESFGSAWIFGLVMVFMLVFSAYLALTISYQKAFKVKNEVLSIIEREQGVTSKTSSNPENWGAVQLINSYLTNMSYRQKGACPEGSKGIDTLDLNANYSNFHDGGGSDKFYYCITKKNSGDGLRTSASYYEVKLFYKFNLPVIGDIYTFDVSGETNDIDFQYDDGLF
jgi:hypothetical protein